MKLRSAAIAAALSLIPVWQPLVVGGGAALTTGAVMLSVPEKARAESAFFYYNRGIDKMNAGDYSGAISDYTKAIEINPKDANAYVNRGVSKASLEDYYGAISDYTKVIDMYPHPMVELRGSAFLGRAAVKKIHFRDMEGACSDLRKASSLGKEKKVAQLIKKHC